MFGKIEFDVQIKSVTDKDGLFYICTIFSIPNYDFVVGPYMRTEQAAFEQCLMLVLKTKNLLNTIH